MPVSFSDYWPRPSKKIEAQPTIPEFIYNPLFIVSIASTSVLTLSGAYVYARHFKRILNAEWVNPTMLKKKRWLRGVVTRYVATKGSFNT